MRGDSHLETTRSVLTSVAKYVPYRAFLPRIDAHLHVGQRNKEYLKHYGIREDQMFFSPHFVDSEFFRERADTANRNGGAAALRAELGIDANAFVCLFVGKLLPIKRPADLVQAIERLAIAHGKQTHAVFVGDGPLRPQLETANKQIHLVGFRNQTELPKWYQSANVLVLPSTAETWGLVVNEAQACGLPAIVSNGVGCAPDLIDECETGFTFQPGDVDALSKLIAKARDLWITEPMRVTAALKKKVAAYSIEAATRGLEAAIQSVRDSGVSKERNKKAVAV